MRHMHGDETHTINQKNASLSDHKGKKRLASRVAVSLSVPGRSVRDRTQLVERVA